ncbi:unnamed protein product [Cylicostephanus goldi]|uniref:Uncharacterized protein n=1 Tax=Cylicostephanus goldi TaxID=71465 RepID=A0A3P6ST57_CYLGO|nr:unnamed protein product [Cylicostephanus goldi]
MSCGAIVNFAATAKRLKRAQQKKLHKPAFHSPVEKISAPFKAIASDLSTGHKKRKKDSVLNTVAEKLDIPTEAVPTPVRKISAPLKTFASELSPSDHYNNVNSMVFAIYDF